jgi:drug/metabolite transporter (DMT)-like permease
VSRTLRTRDWLLLLVLGAVWGGSYFFGKVALAELPPFSVVLARVALGAVALNVVVRVSGHRMPGDRAAWTAFFALGALNNLVPFSLIFWSQTHIASGLAAILNASTPLFSVVLAHWLTRDEGLTPARVAGVLLGFIGVATMVGPDALRGERLNVVAQLAVVGLQSPTRWPASTRSASPARPRSSPPAGS